jgi:hypothetical protein
LQAKYRTEVGTWGNIEHKIILVNDQSEDGYFTLLGFHKTSDVQTGNPCFGVSDVVEFEVFHDSE